MAVLFRVGVRGLGRSEFDRHYLGGVLLPDFVAGAPAREV
jgi:hypothetical protein